MDKIKILIVDDEALARQTIRDFLQERQGIFQIEEAANGFEAIEKIAAFKPALIFLDVEMPEISGFDVLAHLESRPFKIIFETAYQEFAVRAFKENACDYLLKPFSRERFNEALDRALEAVQSQGPLSNLEKAVLPHFNYMNKIVVRLRNHSYLVNAQEILCFVSKFHATFLHTEKADYLCELSLNHLETRLNPQDFIRLHRNNIVRFDAVTAISHEGRMTVTLRNGMALPVSKNNRKAIKDYLLKFSK